VTTTRTPTAERHPADALLAAFVDGRLGGAERRLMVAHLSACESCRHVVAETAKTLRDPELAAWLGEGDADGDDEAEVEPSAGSGRVLRPARSRFRRALPLIATLTAAAAVTALLVSTPTGRGFLGWEQVAVAGLAIGLEDEAVREHFATDGFEQSHHGWDVYLGDPLADLNDETAFQLGVRVSELDVALRLEERAVAKRIAARLSRLSAGMDAVEIYFAEIGKGLGGETPTDTLLLYNSKADELIRTEDTATLAWYDLGRWAAAGQLASKSAEESWFARPPVRRELRRLGRKEWTPVIEGSLDSIAGLIRGRVVDDEWAELRAAFDDLIEAGGNHETWRQPPDPEN
jgi:hypothetical protein